ncbi:S-adenosyl-L-methionine-dependent methyltransferase [Ophiobolus disseminans]|uniref:S-adenosyl-L-methionine-dependent methyltransferase n=1 Tax=Ophiobolus disseminans TaxID=1469910 RepID=A0A6A7AEP5_9PLEO|nr:S-adenosyl-L-methionine-dependent methyltransferase [Ophiobolus disseminans]
MAAQPEKKDWSATQYLKFGNERTRAVHDLLAQVTPHISSPNPRIYDLGCGPGNSTQALLSAFPSARITGMDSSPDMLSKARATLPDVEFVSSDLSTYKPDQAADLLFSNAVFHWLRTDNRIPTLSKLFKNLQPGAVLAIQVPDNYHFPSHTLMRTTACLTNKPWSKYFSSSHIGDTSDSSRPDLDPIEPPSSFYNALSPHASLVNVWRTEYQHVLSDHGAIVEWVRATGLQPYLNCIEDEGAREAFLTEYEERLKGEYERLGDGRVMLGYPRLFVVAVRK